MMDRWNLDSLYLGFEDPTFEQDVAALERAVARFEEATRQMDTAEPAQALKQCVETLEQLEQLEEKLLTYLMLRQAADTRDAQAPSLLGQVLNICSSAASAQADFKTWVARLPELPEVPELQEYRFFLEKLVECGPYVLSGPCEQVLAKMQLSGGNAWAELQQYLTSTLAVSYRDQQLNLSRVRNLASDPDPLVRKEAYEAELAAYPKIQDSVAYALNSIKLETLSECALRGYDSPLDWTLKESHMERKTLDAMFEAMEEYLPKFRQYLKCKAKALGHAQGLPWYDLFAPMGKSSTKFTPESAGDYLVKVFEGFDTDLAGMIRTAFDKDWIDFYPRDGKSGGAFCAEVAALGESRILTNFDGTFSSVVTLAHELGHAFHNLCILPHRTLNHNYSMPVAETASTFNECVVMASAIREAADDQERIALIEAQLQDTTQIICDIYSRYLFESQVFEKRPQAFMNAEELNDMMLDAQKCSYGDGLDYRSAHPYMWICKSHYYGPVFYNFPYAFGGLFARGLYARYEREGKDFLPKYKKLLYATTVSSAEDTARTAGIDLTDREFWRGALQTVADQIDLLCQLLERGSL